MLRPRHCLTLCLALSISVLIAGEVGVHYLYSWGWAWPSAPLGDLQRTGNLGERDETRILLLADPHIQCSFDRYEPWLFRWDSDNYLQRAASRLLASLQPDLVVILGDLFAEGFKADEMAWIQYLQCMRDILAVPADTRLVVLPGDNDIGGEGAESMTAPVNKRFVSQFGRFNEVLSFNGVTLVKLNTVSYIHHFPMNDEEVRVREETKSFLDSVSLSIRRRPQPVLVFSHVPLSELQPSVTNLVLSSLTPDTLFSAHLHYQSHTTHTYTTLHGHEREITEWTVPTCSYRMGEAHMGAGAIFIDHHGRVGYSVVWLPPRYPVLCFYLLFFLSMALALLYRTLCTTGNTPTAFHCSRRILF